MSTREHNSSSKPDRAISTVRRFSQVYVEIPPSPYHRSNYAPKSSRRTSEQHVHTDEERKENDPLLIDSDESMASTSSHAKPRVKRKRSERDLGSASGNDTKMKKQKLSAESNAKQNATAEVLANANEEYPHGFFYCHQCSKKRGALDGLQCTVKQGKSNNSRCKARYCKTCLKNRYGEDMDAIRERGENLPPKDTAEHVRDLGYSFKCPRCNEDCNCRGCRKAKGLEPTGNLTIQAKRTGVDSVATMLTSNAKLTGILPGKGKQIEDLPKKPKEPKPPKTKKAAASTSVSGKPMEKVKRAYIRKPKPLPQPLWSRVPVPASFSLENALARIGIREFVLRFSSVMDVSRACLEELEEIGGVSTRRLHGGDEDEGDDIGVCLGWISEPALKSMLLGLLGLVVESTALGKDGQKAVKVAIRDLRSAGANLNRMWAALASLQSSLESIDLSWLDSSFLSLPDPLPPPASAHIVSTRSGQLHATGVQIVNSAQFLPVVEALVEAAMRTQVVREDIDSGAKEMKETVKAERERSKEEKERWEVVRHAGNATKVERAEHKRILNALEQAQRVALLAQAPRFARLGSDHEGRQYFALTPGAAEQDAALALLSGDRKKSGKARGRAVVNDEDRKALKKWGWFIAVHGQRPEPDPNAVDKPKGKGKQSAVEEDGSDDEEDEDPAAERWWGFWQPEEIRKVAEWIARKNGIVEAKGRAKDAEVVDSQGTKPKDDASKGRTVSRSVSSTAADDTDVDMSTVVSSRASTPLSDVDDEDDETSELSSVSSDVEEEGEEGVFRRDAAGKAVPSKVELRQLVKSLREYADVLEWRIWRMQPEEKDAKETGKGKA
ncbi:hypothetical protein EVG20_g4823 [Dentipellis fragilis]|uniref:Zinc-finger domain-containing protein n=1 Tax=Dentipellis fragilis TaxID=205917 RepID=A0A4Y9YWZ1_9AGAM|nr:hypothetical protein EVG20_g4823 [Dentipellis fragilis]